MKFLHVAVVSILRCAVVWNLREQAEAERVLANLKTEAEKVFQDSRLSLCDAVVNADSRLQLCVSILDPKVFV